MRSALDRRARGCDRQMLGAIGGRFEVQRKSAIVASILPLWGRWQREALTEGARWKTTHPMPCAMLDACDGK